MLCSTNFSMLTICCKCRFPIQISFEIFIHWVKRHLQWCAPLSSTASSVKPPYLFHYHTKTIWWIFMKFSGDIDIDLCHTYKYNVTMDINQCCFYGNINAIFCQIFSHITILLKNYSVNLYEIFRENRYCPLLQLQLYCYYGYQPMWFP